MKIHTAVLSLALISLCSTAMAQWQWLDKDGRRVFSDRAPPLDVMEKDILKRPNSPARAPLPQEAARTDAAAPAPADSASAAARAAPTGSGVDKDLEAKKKQATDAEAAKRKAEEDRMARARVENCARAKQGLTSVDSGIRISRSNASGEREILDDTARAVERKRIQSIMESDCK